MSDIFEAKLACGYPSFIYTFSTKKREECIFARKRAYASIELLENKYAAECSNRVFDCTDDHINKCITQKMDRYFRNVNYIGMR